MKKTTDEIIRAALPDVCLKEFGIHKGYHELCVKPRDHPEPCGPAGPLLDKLKGES